MLPVLLTSRDLASADEEGEGGRATRIRAAVANIGRGRRARATWRQVPPRDDERAEQGGIRLCRRRGAVPILLSSRTITRTYDCWTHSVITA